MVTRRSCPRADATRRDLRVVLRRWPGGELFERLEKVNHFTESQASIMTKKLVSALQVGRGPTTFVQGWGGGGACSWS